MALTIEDGGFKLEQTDIGDDSWDLYAKKTVNHKNGTSSVEWKILSYGISMPYALNKIILCRMAVRTKETTDLKTFFDNYKKERGLVLQQFNLSTINLTKDLLNLQKSLKDERKESK